VRTRRHDPTSIPTALPPRGSSASIPDFGVCYDIEGAQMSVSGSLEKRTTALVTQERVFLALAGIFIAALVSCNLIFQKFFTWTPLGLYTFEISVGILPYPITFLATDIISEIYGKKRADQVVVSGFIASLFVLAVVLVANAVPQTSWSPVTSPEFTKVFGLFGPAVFASMVAYLTAQFIDIRIYHFWKRLTRGRHLWLRNNGSTIVSQLVDTSTVLLLLCFTGAIEWARFPALLENGFLFKVLVALLDTPLIYLATWFLRRLMQLGPGEEIPAQRSLA
jgi:uncharacterized integral membrane protein (TIGR00697 family)